MAAAQPIIGIVVTLIIALALLVGLGRLLITRPTPKPVRIRVRSED